MFIEGLIDKHYLEILIAAGHEPDWIIDNNKDAQKKGYDGFDNSTPLGKDKVIMRLWIPLMATSPCERLREIAEKTLKDI